MVPGDLEALIRLLARLPGLGPRSARRAALHLIARRDGLMAQLALALDAVAREVRECALCRNLDTRSPCAVCSDPDRDAGLLCVVGEVADLWALERTAVFKGRYHVLGGTLSALDGVGPEELGIAGLVARAGGPDVREVVLALGATVDGQTTAHYIAERLAGMPVAVTRLAHGVPVGGELNFLDDGTVAAALLARRPV